MSEQIDLSQRLEVRDATGATVGYLVPVALANGNGGSGPQEAEADRTQLRTLVRSLTEERDRLRRELDRSQSEARQYRDALYALTREPFAFDEADRTDIESNGVTLDEVIEQLERQ
jgi:hypothetical protein